LKDTHLQNNQSKIDWRCGSTGRAPALQVQSPELKPQSNQKKKKKCPKKISRDLTSNRLHTKWKISTPNTRKPGFYVYLILRIFKARKGDSHL
jgi:hypothetical protein